MDKSGVFSTESSMRYGPGNVGDLLKHGFLAEFVRAWARHRQGNELIYYDPFAGLPSYPLHPSICGRLLALRESDAALSVCYSEKPGEYYGSCSVVAEAGRAFGVKTICLASDSDEHKVEKLKSAGIAIINDSGFLPWDGYSILRTSATPNLLLLDPYSEFLKRDARTVVPRIIRFNPDESTVVVFILNLCPSNNVGKGYERLVTKHCAGWWRVKCPPIRESKIAGESNFFSELLIRPAQSLHQGMLMDLMSEYKRYCGILDEILKFITFGEA